MARKKPQPADTEAATADEVEAQAPDVEALLATAREAGEFVDFDIANLEAQPKDGDLCLVKVYDPDKQKAVEGPVSVFDQRRGVFFKCPEHGGGGSVVGPRRDNYKAERLRNVVAFAVVVEDHNPHPPADSIIDHRRGMEHASNRPPKITTPPDRD